MRSKNASALMVLAHSVSTNPEYDLKNVPVRIMKIVADDYRSFSAHASKRWDDMPVEITAKKEIFGRIHARLVELNLI